MVVSASSVAAPVAVSAPLVARVRGQEDSPNGSSQRAWAFSKSSVPRTMEQPAVATLSPRTFAASVLSTTLDGLLYRSPNLSNRYLRCEPIESQHRYSAMRTNRIESHLRCEPIERWSGAKILTPAQGRDILSTVPSLWVPLQLVPRMRGHMNPWVGCWMNACMCSCTHVCLHVCVLCTSSL